MSKTAGLIIHGAGRMGEAVYTALAEQNRLILQAVVSPTRPGWLSKELWFPSLLEMERKPAVLIDFSAAAAIPELARWSARSGVALLSGTTALTDDHLQALEQAARTVPVLHAANFSRGVNVLLMLAAEVAKALPGCEHTSITDIHHQHKKDAPSGTALALREALAGLNPVIESRRQGESPGEHRVLFSLPGETLELAHVATDRAIFARGAVQAARWLSKQRAGLYSARDWIQHG